MDKQLTEDYVSFEIAKLLKEKGFDIPVRFEYHCIYNLNQKPQFHRKLHNFNGVEYFGLTSKWYSAPSQSLALKWLREVHKILILIDWNLSEKEYIAYIWDIEKERQQGLHKLRKDGKYLFQYPSYETCIEESILYVLKSMI